MRGLQRLIEDDNDCVDVLTQVSATTRALESFAIQLVEQHLQACAGGQPGRGGPEAKGHGDNGSDCQIGAIMKQQINVQGMTCEHCVKAVAEELSAVTGVTDVQINLVADGTSTVVVETDQTLTDEQIRAALSEAGGYQLV